MSNLLEKMSLLGVVPVVVLDNAKDAVPLGRAMQAGGIPCAEITLRTAAGLASISAMAEMGEDMLVGAGSVITLDNCKDALSAGAKFIVSPGFNPKVVEYCVERDIPVLPGCVTPTEIMAAMELGLGTVKFFPANVYGGLSAMKALSGPFPKMKFIPTGGVNGDNLAEYLAAPFIQAVGGSWLCAKADVNTGSFDKITALCQEARRNMLGFEVAHIGINTPDREASLAVCSALNAAFGLPIKEGNSSNFASPGIEIMNSNYLGANGHIAIRTNSIPRALAELEAKGFQADQSTAKFKGEKMIAIYLKQEFGGFAIHLLQK
ncbi:MAG: bifunctional 4-hydroxy-2-oxoglutarate aldolase/2-dehydro-3-deoxy-phosphogluconate aldolase [Lawsonibacter sp.]|nr:bifunctional 4-hydroxy-2-oxoglutarate aldolase/2-dehydro-3-deoxy-phosphogluconate aldolase [Lawsonibacter sp.]